MKKVLSLMLATVMMVMCLCTPGFAAAGDVTVSADTITTMISLLDANMPGTQALRAQVFDVLKLYVSTDLNMQTLIETVETLGTDGESVPGNLQPIVNQLGSALTSNKENVLLVLDVIYALPEADRVNAIDEFVAAQDAVEQNSFVDGVFQGWAEEEKINDSETFQDALDTVYDYFVSNDGTLATHGVGPNTILLLSKAFTDNLLLTDDEDDSSDFAVEDYSNAFGDRLETNIAAHFSSINGNSDLSADAILNAFVAALNDLPNSVKEEAKVVLGDDEIGLYVEREEERQPNYTPSGRGPSVVVDTTDDLKDIVPDVSNPPAQPPVADSATVYSDTAEHWAKDYVGALTARKVLNGYGDGSYQPDQGITREEIAVALTRALGLEAQAAKASKTRFTDSAEISDWASASVNLMVKNGIFKGNDLGEFMPKRVITREEMIAVIVRVFSDNIAIADLTYTDDADISDWARQYVKKATNLDIVSGYPDGSIRPLNGITRAEAAKVLYNFMHYAGLL